MEQTYDKDLKDVSGSKRLLDVIGYATGNNGIAKDIFQKIFYLVASKKANNQTIDYVMLLTEELTYEYSFKTFTDTGVILL